MSQSFRELFEKAAQTDEFWVEDAITEFTNSLHEAMEAEGISKVELARRLHTTPSAITRLLSGNANFTFKTVVRLARAVNRSFVPWLGDAKAWSLGWQEQSTREPQAVAKEKAHSGDRRQAPPV